MSSLFGSSLSGFKVLLKLSCPSAGDLRHLKCLCYQYLYSGLSLNGKVNISVSSICLNFKSCKSLSKFGWKRLMSSKRVGMVKKRTRGHTDLLATQISVPQGWWVLSELCHAQLRWYQPEVCWRMSSPRLYKQCLPIHSLFCLSYKVCMELESCWASI